MDAMRLINTYTEFFNKDLFRETEALGYRTFTDFCNDALDTIEYEVSISLANPIPTPRPKPIQSLTLPNPIHLSLTPRPSPP